MQLVAGQKNIEKKKPLTELYVTGSFTEDSGAWEEELQRDCAEVHVDLEEAIEEQEKRNMKYKEDGRQTLYRARKRS